MLSSFSSSQYETILVTGGAGFIGSHTVVELLEKGYNVVIIDALLNSHRESINRIKEITKKDNLFQYEGYLQDEQLLETIFNNHKISYVIHFAGLKAVGESVAEPLLYYNNNIGGTLSLLKVMEKHQLRNIIFSSSATVYGDPDFVPIPETAKTSPINPYGRTKHMIELILNDVAQARPDWGVVILRYFNPVGAHPSGRIGENPKGIPNNLVPLITQVAIGKHPFLTVFGNDYPTHDGTGVRDYIHVVDLAKGHVSAIEFLASQKRIGQSIYQVFNLGTGQGYSVLEILKAMEEASGKTIEYKFGQRRSGDVAICFSDPTKAEELLKWKATKSLKDMCLDAWRWQSNNPHGYCDEDG